ncbi:MAG: hypothetical protein F6K58_30520 [Symploca sp. SIO2E9]|nr:hypothetical protein [Symploca sp. SIO2E9]
MWVIIRFAIGVRDFQIKKYPIEQGGDGEKNPYVLFLSQLDNLFLGVPLNHTQEPK